MPWSPVAARAADQDTLLRRLVEPETGRVPGPVPATAGRTRRGGDRECPRAGCGGAPWRDIPGRGPAAMPALRGIGTPAVARIGEAFLVRPLESPRPPLPGVVCRTRSGRAATLSARSERYRPRRLVPGNAGRKCNEFAPGGPADSALPGGDGSGPRLSVRIVLTERADPLSVFAATGLRRRATKFNARSIRARPVPA